VNNVRNLFHVWGQQEAQNAGLPVSCGIGCTRDSYHPPADADLGFMRLNRNKITMHVAKAGWSSSMGSVRSAGSCTVLLSSVAADIGISA